jgi:hypothetical protein
MAYIHEMRASAGPLRKETARLEDLPSKDHLEPRETAAPQSSPPAPHGNEVTSWTMLRPIASQGKRLFNVHNR